MDPTPQHVCEYEGTSAEAWAKMAREANAACIEQWNRADKAEAAVQRVRELAEKWRSRPIHLVQNIAERQVGLDILRALEGPPADATS